jgi:hypothetical protein
MTVNHLFFVRLWVNFVFSEVNEPLLKQLQSYDLILPVKTVIEFVLYIHRPGVIKEMNSIPASIHKNRIIFYRYIPYLLFPP